MNETNQGKPLNPTETSGGVGSAPGAQDSTSRRRAVLRRLGSGAAIAAAASPLKALATGGRKSCFHKDHPGKWCKASVSAMGSPIGSAMVAEWPESPGKHCNYWKTKANWPKNNNKACVYGRNGTICYHGEPKNGNPYNGGTTYNEMFGCNEPMHGKKTIGQIMDEQIAPHCNWVTACLNATYYGSQFCYSPHEVTVLHNDQAKNMYALSFFKDYQENYLS